jgi:oxalate decarboxylase
VFDKIPSPNPYILNSTNGQPAKQRNVTGGTGELTGDAGQWWKIDSTNFPIAKTIASTYVVIEPKGVRELHWHPTVSIHGNTRSNQH